MAKGIYGPRGYDLPRGRVCDNIAEIAEAHCGYVYTNYGRFPKHHDAMFIPLLLQVHHLDVGFYERFYRSTLVPPIGCIDLRGIDAPLLRSGGKRWAGGGGKYIC